MQGIVREQGTIELGKNFPWAKMAGALASYEFSSPESMFRTATRHDYVKRPDGKIIKGWQYTLKCAKNDWEKEATLSPAI